MSWDDFRFVLALAKGGSLARAARELAVDHSTVGRRIEALEADLGVRLFTRTTSGYIITPEGEELLPEIRQVESAVLAVDRAVHARDDGLRGVVRLTATEAFSSRYLAPRLAPFVRRYPELTIELFTGNPIFDLARREADIAVRFFRSKHDHLAMRRAGTIAYALYASEEYLRCRPMLAGSTQLEGHYFVIDDMPLDRGAETTWLERAGPRARIALATNSTSATLSATLGGIGIALLPRYLGDAEPSLHHVPMPDEPVSGIWLTVHRDLRQTRRVRAMLDYLAEVIEADAALLGGRPVEGRSPGAAM